MEQPGRSKLLQNYKPTPPRAVPVQSGLMISRDDWVACRENEGLFGVKMVVAGASDAEVQVHSAHASASDLFSISGYFNTMMKSALYNPDDLRRYILDINAKQEYLHVVIESLYAGSILLSTDNVEAIFMIADALAIDCVKLACSHYLLHDCTAEDNDAILLEVVQMLQLHDMQGSLQQAILDRFEQVDWGKQVLHQALDEFFNVQQAEQLLISKRVSTRLLCEIQVSTNWHHSAGQAYACMIIACIECIVSAVMCQGHARLLDHTHMT